MTAVQQTGGAGAARSGPIDLPPARQPDHVERWLTERGRPEPSGGQDGAVRAAWPPLLAADDTMRLAVPRAFDRLVLLPGGVPLAVGRTVVGSVGISGGSYDQDSQIADAALRAWQSL